MFVYSHFYQFSLNWYFCG